MNLNLLIITWNHQ